MSDATMTRPRELTAGVGVLGAPDVTEEVMVDDRRTGVPHHEQLSQDMNSAPLRAGARRVKVW
ncbi:hypothetical protein GCM10027054_06580 [Isoptericola nanjingensis]